MLNKLELRNRLSEFMSEEEELAYFNEVCDRIIKNPRFYLNHLDELFVFECHAVWSRSRLKKHKPFK